MRARDKLIIALDYPRAEEAYAMVRQVGELVNFFKVGMQLYYAEGPAIVQNLKKMGVKIFLDLKLHDIPNTVAGAAEVAVHQGVDMFNLHLGGGRRMVEITLERIKEARKELRVASPPPIILGVTVLTSLNETMLKEELGVDRSMEEQVLFLAQMGQAAGLDGVVASPKELALLRRSLDRDFLIVTPGIRPCWAAVGEQERVLTPREAIDSGADYLVIGRPVTKHSSPREALQKIIEEIEKVEGGSSRCLPSQI